jgi:hypothetical protein
MTVNATESVHQDMAIIQQENVFKNAHKLKILLQIHKQNFVLQFARLELMQTMIHDHV